MIGQVGRVTLALALVLAGTFLLIESLTGWTFAFYLVRFWPVLLIMLGLEWVYASRRLAPGEPVKVDGAAIGALVVLAMFTSIFGQSYRIKGMLHLSPAPAVSARPPRTPVMPLPPASPPAPLLGGAGEGSTQTQIFDQPVPGLKSLEVRLSSTDLRVEAGPAFKAELEITTYGAARSGAQSGNQSGAHSGAQSGAQAGAQAGAQSSAQANAEQVRLRVEPGETTRVRFDHPAHLSRTRSVLRLTVPAEVQLRLKTTSGTIEVLSIDSPIDLESTTGGLSVTNAGGDVTATTSTGSIRLAEVKGAVRASSSSGMVYVLGSRGAITVQASSGTLNVQPHTVNGTIRLTTSSGSQTLLLPTDADVAITARASSGVVSAPGWFQLSSGQHNGSGRQGQGTHQVDLTAGSGSIRIMNR